MSRHRVGHEMKPPGHAARKPLASVCEPDARWCVFVFKNKEEVHDYVRAERFGTLRLWQSFLRSFLFRFLAKRRRRSAE